MIVDGYPGLVALEREFDEDKSHLIRLLEDHQFQVPDSSWSSYASTELAIPAILDMSYPVENIEVNNATRRGLHEVIGGSNESLRVFAQNGYHTTMIESGWVGSACGQLYDRCIASPWIDELLFGALWDTVAAPAMLDVVAHPYTAGTLRSMKYLEEFIRQSHVDPTPRFVIAHLLAPHPPFFLDSDCQIVVSDQRLATSFSNPQMGDLRDSYFIEQSECIDSFMERIAALATRDDVVIFVGDHGTRRKDILTEEGHPNPASMVERMNVFLAARLSSRCLLGNEILTTNLMRRVLSCYSEVPIEDAPNRMFLRDGSELTESELDALVGNERSEDSARYPAR